MPRWATTPLGDLCDVIGGGTPAKNQPAYYAGEIPWATVRDMRNEIITETEFRITKEAVQSSATNIIPAHNVVIATRVGLGKVCMVGQDTAINQDLRGIVPRDSNRLAVRFLFWFLKNMSDVIIAEGTGATVQGVKLPFVKSLKVPAISLPEQQRIIAILDEAFEEIATAKGNAERNLLNAQAIFESRLDAVFTQSGDDWVDKSMGELVADGALAKPFDGNHGEIHPRKADFKKAGVPFVMASDLHDGEVNTHHCAFLSRKQADALRVGFAKDGDVLISHKGTIGRSAIVKTTDDYIMLTPQVTAYRVADFGKLYNRYIRYFFMSQAFQQRMIAGAADGSTRAYIGITKQLSLRLRFPSVAKQKTIAAQLDLLLPETQRLTNIYEKKLIALDALKKSLLHSAFSGDMRAKKGADRVEAAA